MERHLRFGEAFASQKELVEKQRLEAESVNQGYQNAGVAGSNVFGINSNERINLNMDEYTRMALHQQFLRYAPIDNFDDPSTGSLSSGDTVGALDVRSQSTIPSLHSDLSDYSEFDDAPALYCAYPYDQLSNTKGCLVPYDTTTSVESRSQASSSPTSILPVRPPRHLPPQVVSSETIPNENQTIIRATSIVDNGSRDRQQNSSGFVGPRKISIPRENLVFPPFHPRRYQTMPKPPKGKPLKVYTYEKMGKPVKVKITPPTWPPPPDKFITFNLAAHPPEPNEPKSKKYIPAFRDIGELIKEDNRCAQLYGVVHDLDDDYECNISATTVPRVMEWSGFHFPPQLTRIIIDEFHYAKPRKVQQIVAPLLLSGYDVICRMENASGKTMSYILPMFTILHDRLKSGKYTSTGFDDNASHPFALIIADTRELTTQIYEQICKCNFAFGYKVSRCIGEYDRRVNIQELMAGVEIVVATPGRLRDVVQSGYLRVSELQYIVFDEADKIFSPGFYEALNSVFQRFPDLHQRQMSFFGATMNVPMDLGQFLRHGYATVANLTYKIAPRLNFNFCFVNRRTRYSNFLTMYAESIINAKPNYATKILIFMRTIDECNQIRSFMQKHLNCARVLGMNSSRNQHQRDEIIKELRCFQPTYHLVVVTTNLMARGIDIPEVNHVIHFSVEDFDDFVNRSGRTGRLCDGYVHVLIDKDASIPNVKMIRESLQSIKHPVPPEVDLFINSRFNEINFV